MRSLDPIDELAAEISNERSDLRMAAKHELNIQLVKSQGVTAQRVQKLNRRDTSQAQVEPSIVSESEDDISRAAD